MGDEMVSMNTTTQPTAPSTPDADADPRPLLAAVLDQTERLILGTDPADLARPTPCGDWAVAALQGHVLAVVERLRLSALHLPLDDAPRLIETDDWSSAWAAARAGAEVALADDRCLVGEIVRPFGTVPATEGLLSYVSELATHGWDVAVATGRADQLDPALAVAGLACAQRNIPAQIRHLEGVPFDAVVEIDDEADAYARLVAWNGRNPAWNA